MRGVSHLDWAVGSERIGAVLGSTWRERAISILMAATIAYGIFLRCRGIFGSSHKPFWLDEAMWAVWLMELPLSELLIRPPGFMLFSRAMAFLFGPSEVVLRLLPWGAGIAALCLSPFLARRIFRAPAAQALLVAAVALHPEAVDHAREFKPYSVGLFLHMLLLLFVLRYRTTRTTRDLVWTLVVAVAAVTFTQDIIFAYPAAFLLVGFSAFQARRFSHLWAAVGAGALIIGLLGAQYVFIWSHMEAGETDYWGNKYDVFYIPEKAKTSRAAWFARKYYDTAAYPGRRRVQWDGSVLKKNLITKKQVKRLMKVDRGVWLALHIAGILVLAFRRRFDLLLLFLTPLATMSIFNFAGYWPFGDFRTNLFMLTYTLPLAAAAFEFPGAPFALAPLPGLAMVLAPFIVLSPEKKRRVHAPTHSLDVPVIIDQLIQLQGEDYHGAPEIVLLDELHCDPWAYYAKYNPGVAPLHDELTRRFRTVCIDKDEQAIDLLRKEPEDARIWILSVKSSRKKLPKLERRLSNDYDIELKRTISASITRQVKWRKQES